MNPNGAAKLEKIFRRRFDEVLKPRMGMPEDRALQAGFDEWNRWLRDNDIETRLFDDHRGYDPSSRVRIYDPTGFKVLFVPVDLAEKALFLGGLP